MDSKYNVETAEPRLSQTAQELNELANLVTAVKEISMSLRKKLDPITRIQPESIGKDSPEQTLVALAENIRSIRKELSQAKDILVDLVENTEI